MKKIVNILSCLLCVLVLFSGILMTGCTDKPLDQTESPEQGNDENQEENKPTDDNDGITYVVNDAWTIEFNSPGIYEGYEYDYVVSVTSTDDNYYFLSLIAEDYYLESDIDVLAPQLYQFLLESLESYNAGYTFLDLCSNESSSQYYPLTPGNKYRAVVLGVTDKGKLNGLYAVSELISIEE